MVILLITTHEPPSRFGLSIEPLDIQHRLGQEVQIQSMYPQPYARNHDENRNILLNPIYKPYTFKP